MAIEAELAISDHPSRGLDDIPVVPRIGSARSYTLREAVAMKCTQRSPL